MVLTGGELTLFQAVGPSGSDFLSLCRSSPVKDARRDLIGAWRCPQQAMSAGRPPRPRRRRTRSMIVLGADTHKRSHAIAAVVGATGELLGERTVRSAPKGFAALLRWARRLDTERVWAIEDCRHVSGSLEQVLIARGERVVRVSTRLMAASRRGAATREVRQHRRVAVARAALREGVDAFRPRTWTGPRSDLGCSSITASGSSASASRSTTRCTGICTTLARARTAQAARCSTATVDRGSRRRLRARRADDRVRDRARRAAPASATHR